MSGLKDKLNSFFDVFASDSRSYDFNYVIYEGESAFHHISIREENGVRTMYFGPCGEEAETAINISNPEQAVFEYPGMMLAALPLLPEKKRILMIGLGGGYLPALFQKHLPQYSLTVVELDLLVAELAQTYFGFSPTGNVELVISDGRDFIENSPEASLDQIWLDAFSGDYVPPALSGTDFLELCRSRLVPGGLLVQNLHQSRPAVFEVQLRNTRLIFDNFIALDGVRCGNAIVISQAPGGNEEWLDWSKDRLVALAKQFGPRVGPYDLSKEMKKFKLFNV